MVIEGVPDSKETSNQGDERSSRCVSTVEKTIFQARDASCRCAFGQFGVEVDERSETVTRSTRLQINDIFNGEILGERVENVLGIWELQFWGGTSPPSWRRMREACMMK